VGEFVARYGPWAVVTGAAQGVGLAFTEALIARGLGVVMVDVDPRVTAVAAALGITPEVVQARLDAIGLDAATMAHLRDAAPGAAATALKCRRYPNQLLNKIFFCIHSFVINLT